MLLYQDEDEEQDVALKILENGIIDPEEIDIVRKKVRAEYKREFFKRKYRERSLFSLIPGYEKLQYIDIITYPEREDEEEKENEINYSLAPIILMFLELRIDHLIKEIHIYYERKCQARYDNRLGTKIRFMVENRLKEYGLRIY